MNCPGAALPIGASAANIVGSVPLVLGTNEAA